MRRWQAWIVSGAFQFFEHPAIVALVIFHEFALELFLGKDRIFEHIYYVLLSLRVVVEVVGDFLGKGIWFKAVGLQCLGQINDFNVIILFETLTRKIYDLSTLVRMARCSRFILVL